MEIKPKIDRTIDDYIASFPADVQEVLQKIRAAVREAAPEAEEAMRYGAPTFRLNGNLVHFAAHRGHIGFYPTPSAIEKFQPELAGYKSAKGSVQFPLNQPIPYDMISRMVRFRVEENRNKAGKKRA